MEESSVASLFLKMVSQPVHPKALCWRKYSTPTSHHFQERSASTHWSEIGTRPDGRSSTSLKSSDACSLYPFQSQVWMRRRAENSWTITSHSARWPKYRRKYTQGRMHNRRVSWSIERSENTISHKLRKLHHTLTALPLLAASKVKDKSFNQYCQKKIKTMDGQGRAVARRKVRAAETRGRSPSRVPTSYHVRRRWSSNHKLTSRWNWNRKFSVKWQTHSTSRPWLIRNSATQACSYLTARWTLASSQWW